MLNSQLSKSWFVGLLLLSRELTSNVELGYAAVDAICDYYQNLSKQTVKAKVQPGYLLDQLPREPDRN